MRDGGTKTPPRLCATFACLRSFNAAQRYSSGEKPGAKARRGGVKLGGELRVAENFVEAFRLIVVEQHLQGDFAGEQKRVAVFPRDGRAFGRFDFR